MENQFINIQVKSTAKQKGITLIALVITIIVLLILASVSIAMLTGSNSVINKANEATVKSTISQIKEEIELYKTGEYINGKENKEAYPIAKTEEGKEITIKDMLTEEELAQLPEELKYQMLSMQSENSGNTIPSIENLDYTQFYKLDTDIIQSAKTYKDKLVIFVNGDKYKVIHIDGIKYENNKINIIIPLNNEEEPQYAITANNTYKFYGDGTVKTLGEKSILSGITANEEAEINGTQELNIEEINKQFGNCMALPAKRTYMSTGTIYIIDQNNELWAWGKNASNKMGQGNSYIITEPTKILEGRTEGAENVKAKNVWAGGTNTFVVDTENRVWVCGTNNSGSLGQGNQNLYNNFRQVANLDGSQIEDVYMSIGTQTSNIFVKYTNGEVYVAGNNGWGELGTGNQNNLTQFTLMSSYNSNMKDIKKVVAFGVTNIVLKNNGELYGAGYNDSGNLGISDKYNKSNFNMITTNIKDIEYAQGIYSDYFICLDQEGNIYNIRNQRVEKINEIEANTENRISSYGIVKANGKLYRILEGEAAEYKTEYSNTDILEDTIYMQGFKSNVKTYLVQYPDITKIGKKCNYTLKTTFNDAIFINTALNKVNVVNKKGELFENFKKAEGINNAQKIISSSSSDYYITNDNKLYAKGNEYTGLWGSMTEKNQYVSAMKNENEAFENIKNIYTSKPGYAAIFTTKDNKVYWSGSTEFIYLPNIKGDIQTTGMGKVTLYPKEVKSETLDKIKDKIKDIKSAFVNSGGITGKVTYILTENGELYTISNNEKFSGNGKVTSDFERLEIEAGTTVKQVETAVGFSMAVLSNGEVYGWGYNTYGLLGDGYEIGQAYTTPVKMNLPNNIETICLAEQTAIFISKTGEVYGIGANSYGQLGTGNSKGVNTFVRCAELEK